jgi:hypothetical protein
MNASTLAAFPLRHTSRLRASAIALASAALLASVLAACSVGATASVTHACADRVAQATVGSAPGLWNCLAPSLQVTLKSIGHQGDAALVKTPFALAAKYLGQSTDVATYEVTLLPAVAKRAGVNSLVLAVWIDSSGHVINLGVPSPLY